MHKPALLHNIDLSKYKILEHHRHKYIYLTIINTKNKEREYWISTI